MTPTLIEIDNRHKAFMAKIAASARPDHGITCRPARPIEAPAPVEPEPEPEPLSLPPIPDHLMREAEVMLSILAEGGNKFGPRIELIQKAVLQHFPGVTITDLLSVRRDAAVIEPRQISMYLCKAMTTRSTTEIGRRFGGRDHTTVIHACRKIAARIAQFDHFAAFVGMIKSELTP